MFSRLLVIFVTRTKRYILRPMKNRFTLPLIGLDSLPSVGVSRSMALVQRCYKGRDDHWSKYDEESSELSTWCLFIENVLPLKKKANQLAGYAVSKESPLQP